MKVQYILGIDISKDKFDVSLRQPKQDQPLGQSQFPNTPLGFNKLLRWLRKHKVTKVHACMEATSRYGDALALFFHQHQQDVSIVNPRRIRRYADSLLVRSQNDALDADIIARFCASQNPRLWVPPPAALRQLQDLTRLRLFLVGQSTRLQNRLHTESKVLARLLKQHINQLQKTIHKIETQIATFLEEHKEIGIQVALVDSISGIGLVTAAAAVSELPPIEQLEHAGQAVALAGLDPIKKTSGTSVSTVPRVSKMGSRPLRAALYMAALTALRTNPLVRAQGQRLRSRGKSGKAIICAAMRKLVRLIFGVLKHRQPFDPNWRNTNRATPCAEAEASGGDGRKPAIASPPVATA